MSDTRTIAAQDGIKDTRRIRRVLTVLLTGAPNLSGIVICRCAGIGSGTVHPALARLEWAGWVDSAWQEGVPPGQPRRRFYHLTPRGRYGAMQLLGLEEDQPATKRRQA